jgi:hypothetical protein
MAAWPLMTRSIIAQLTEMYLCSGDGNANTRSPIISLNGPFRGQNGASKTQKSSDI